jgi:hypothetical protein
MGRIKHLMDTVNIIDLDVEKLNDLIDKGRRFYVNTESNVLPVDLHRNDRDAFWGEGDEQSNTL